jgi:hypothetical protein
VAADQRQVDVVDDLDQDAVGTVGVPRVMYLLRKSTTATVATRGVEGR